MNEKWTRFLWSVLLWREADRKFRIATSPLHGNQSWSQVCRRIRGGSSGPCFPARKSRLPKHDLSLITEPLSDAAALSHTCRALERQGCFNPPPHQSSPTVSSRCSFCEKLCRGADGRKFQKNDSGFVQNHKTVRVAATRRAGELTESTLTSRPASALKSERLHETSVKALLWFSGPPVVGSDLLRRGSPNKFWVVLWLEKTFYFFFASNGFKVLGGFTEMFLPFEQLQPHRATVQLLTSLDLFPAATRH